MKRKLAFFWIKIPCEKKVGSCYYEDVCIFSPYKNDSTCPKLFTDFNIPCKCPVLKVKYRKFPNKSGQVFLHEYVNKTKKLKFDKISKFLTLISFKNDA